MNGDVCGRFVSDTSANGLHFQVYLMDGLVRWNRDRAAAATTQATAPSPNSLPLMAEANRLHRQGPAEGHRARTLYR